MIVAPYRTLVVRKQTVDVAQDHDTLGDAMWEAVEISTEDDVQYVVVYQLKRNQRGYGWYDHFRYVTKGEAFKSYARLSEGKR